ncbi:MAG: 16S rRNA (cytosine(967)-C(5))-methyltransferase RsmB [Proteobacteria bacterium]|nr:16S rRNA (cytosine(967)-C(5))-methyltransferase RsmB [Sideroxydans sp.]MBU4152315.1 16S rRNA (cytosine(967)-C(5))-methyltransferase RsmB [Pseudomonadota bacterium]
MGSCPRSLAIEILCRWQQDELPIDTLLEPQLRNLTDGRDRNLVRAIVAGTLRNLGAIDWLLAKVSKIPLPRLNPLILQTLRVGVYQILYLDRVPQAAAIHATVEAVKRKGEPRWLTGFVNGVLRAVVRGKEEFLRVINAGKIPPEALFNHPGWLIARWRDRYGAPALKAICRSNAQPARLCLRVNTRLCTVAELVAALTARNVEVTPGSYLPESLWIDHAGAVTDLPGYNEGWFLVQDEIAQLVAGLVLPFPSGDCLDGCAGLGGKTAALAGIVPEGCRVFAVEPHPRRQQLFKENMTRLGLSGIVLYDGTLAEFAAATSMSFAAVLIDAPCSGLGVTGRHPDIRWQRKESDLPQFQAKQVAILSEAADLVADGGVLVYVTCSTEPEENEAVVSLFRQVHPQFILENAALSLPEAARPLVDEQGFLRTLPGHHGTSDGFFGARMRRVS